MKYTNIVCIFFLLQLNQAAWSQSQAVFTHLDLKDGLVDTRIEAIYQDSVGFMWFGTEYGLSRYDGHRMQEYSYDPEKPQINLPTSVYQISRDPKNQMWVLEDLQGGLSLYIPERDTFLTYLENEGVQLTSFYCDHSDRMWVGTLDRGLLQLDLESGRVESFSSLFQKKLDPLHVSAISEDRLGHLWFSDPDGLYQLKWADSSLKYYALREKQARTLAAHLITVPVHQDHMGKLWVGTSSGLFTFDSVMNKFVLFPLTQTPDKPEPTISAIVEAADGKLWVGTEASGLFSINTQSGLISKYSASLDHPHSLRSNKIWSLYVDRDENLWVGTFDKGVSFLGKHRKPFFTYGNPPGISSEFATAPVVDFHEKKNGSILITGDRGGLKLFDPNTNKFSPGIDLRVYRIVEDNSGTIWMGDWGNGLFGLQPDGNQVSRYQTSTAAGALPGDEISEMLIDQNDRLYLGVWDKSLVRFFPKQGIFQPVPLIKPQTQDTIGKYIYHIYEGINGDKWLGTYYEVIQLDQDDKVINVFAYTYTLIQDQFPCEYRGQINAKGKGELDMYFVDE